MRDHTASLKVALVQSVPHPGDIERNVLDAADLISQLPPDVTFALFPELSLVGYDLSLLRQSTSWIVPADSRLEPLQKVSAQRGVVLVVGAPVVDDGGVPRLCSLVFQPGKPWMAVPKTFLHGEEEDYFIPGTTDAPGIIDVNGWKVGIGICFDAAVPAHAAAVAAAGAEAYAVSGLYTSGQERRLDIHMASRAMDHAMFTLLANLGGTGPGWTSCGRTGTWDTSGNVRTTTADTAAAVVIDEIRRPGTQKTR